MTTINLPQNLISTSDQSIDPTTIDQSSSTAIDQKNSSIPLTTDTNSTNHPIAKSNTNSSIIKNCRSRRSTSTFLQTRAHTSDLLGLKTQGLPLRFRQLSVYSNSSDHILVLNLPRAFIQLFTTPLLKITTLIDRYLLSRELINPRTIRVLSHLNGLLHQSELLLVLGRPGSGVTSTLRTLSSTEAKFSLIDGQLDYGSLVPKALRQLGLQSEIVLVEESDDHFGSLTLGQTLALAARCKTPERRSDGISRQDWSMNEISAWIKAFRLNLSNWNTPVGSSHVHGLSGGERRRVSILEGLMTDCSILCLDNATAGLDSSTAIQMIDSLKEWARLGKRSAIVGLRQASDSLYSQFDKLLLLYSGHQIYFGPITEAVKYFEDLGFERAQAQPAADFLCAVTDPETCRIRDGYQDRVPRSPIDFVKAYEHSKQYNTLKHEMIEYESLYPSSGPAHHVLHANRAKKDGWTANASPYTVNYFRQVAYLVLRQWALIRADIRPYMTKTIVNVMLSLIIGSLFYQLPATTEAAFTRGSVLFLSILFNGYLQLSELANTLAGRPIVQRHRRFGFYSPGALALARTISDLPLIAFQVSLFGSITYFMAGLQADIPHFLTYLLIVYATALNLTAIFRMFASLSPSFDEAMRYCGITLNILVVYAGYFIPTPTIRPGLRWIRYYIDPISYAYEAVLANEFRGLELKCSEQHIVPNGPSYNNTAYQTCAVPGAQVGSLIVKGEEYLKESYEFSSDHLVPNLLSIIGLALIFFFASIWFSSTLDFFKLGAVRVFKDGESFRKKLKKLEGIEESEESKEGEETNDSDDNPARAHLLDVHDGLVGDSLSQFDPAVVTFKDLSWSVKTQSGSVDLLTGITGYIQPGECTALMGASGAGKTTLLNVIAGRLSSEVDGSMSGRVLVDGRSPSLETYKSIGFVGQIDCHCEKSTVREALRFSALLRQPRSVPRWAKLADVERVMEMLGLVSIADAIIGTPEAGLGLEDRKRLSIAVELVARPRVLCVDEPVSGLEGRAAAHIIQLLCSLAKGTGLGVIVTIHQPSKEMFEQFDRLLLLERGGRTVYFGPRERAVEWFEDRVIGNRCGVGMNPAEYLIEMVSGDEDEDEEEDEEEEGERSHLNGSDSVTSPEQSNRKPTVEGSIIVTDPRGRQSIVVRESHALRWLQSREQIEVISKLDELSQQTVGYPATDASRGAQTWSEEVLELTRRCSLHFWRDSVFSFTQLFTSLVIGGLIGLSFGTQEPLSLSGLKSRVFSVFLILFVPPVIMNQLIMKSFSLKNVYQLRESRSGVYRKSSLTLGFVLAELPYCIVSGLIFWITWFWGGYRKLIISIGFVTWAIWISGLAPTIGVVANLLPFFLVSMEAFNGSLIPYAQMPFYWRWMYWISPFQWYVRAVLSLVLHDVSVRCVDHEWVNIIPPPSMTCEEYMSDFGRVNEQCQYCPYSNGDEFVDELLGTKAAYQQSYHVLGIFFIYVLLNLLLVWVFGRDEIWRRKKSGKGKIGLL
ncbi:ABC-2 type transporter-domain-containing protein [Melampsora americana]|nr:ABC-2 type transporter-domain-containing protein [Melampsora americana]